MDVEAPKEHDSLPTHCALTIAEAFAALQDALTAHEPHEPDGVPYAAKRISLMTPDGQAMLMTSGLSVLATAAQKGEARPPPLPVEVATSTSASAGAKVPAGPAALNSSTSSLSTQ